MTTPTPPLITPDMPVSDALLRVIAHLPTRSLATLLPAAYWQQLTDADFMRIAVWLAEKSYAEGGCPIGAVIVSHDSGEILGKGHNTLVQENHPYNHGETAAIRDAGRQDFTRATLYTSLSPCDVCATLVKMRGFQRVVVGDVTSARGNEAWLREQGVKVDILEDTTGIARYQAFRAAQPELEQEDWQGLRHSGGQLGSS